MRKKHLSCINTVCALTLAFFGIISANVAVATPPLTSEADQLSYSIGYSTGKNMAKFQINQEAFVSGMQDAMQKKVPLLEEQQMMKTLQAFREKQMPQHDQQPQSEQAKKNLAESQAFLIKNRENKEITELPNGMQYQVIAAGDEKAKSPLLTDTVKVHYRGTLVDGKEFDSSYARKQPATFELGLLIKAWQEALTRMKPNGKWRIFVPPHLGYGQQGAAPLIGPNVVLIFDIELLAVNPA